MINAVKSELFLARKRPVGFAIGAFWILLIVMFAYSIPFIIGKTFSNAVAGATVMQVVSMPQFAATVLGSYPMFGGAVFLILGALIVLTIYSAIALFTSAVLMNKRDIT